MSSSDLLSQDPKSQVTRDRRRTNSFAQKSADEKDDFESLKKWNFDFDVDSDSLESFNSANMTNSLPVVTETQLP